MLIGPATFDALVDLVQSNPEWKSWAMIKDLRSRGFEIPQRWVVQRIRVEAEESVKKEMRAQGPDVPTQSRLESQMRKSTKASTTIRANKRKAKLKAKHRRQRARAAA